MVRAVLIPVAGLFGVGCCGLLMCRAMLRSTTASALQKEAASQMLLRANFSSLNSPRPAGAFVALYASAERRELLSRQGLSPGFMTPR